MVKGEWGDTSFKLLPALQVHPQFWDVAEFQHWSPPDIHSNQIPLWTLAGNPVKGNG